MTHWNQPSATERIIARGWDVVDSGCWELRGKNRHKDGYGVIKSHQKNVKVHRLMFEHWHRALTGGEVVRRTCDNPICINPDHLQAGSQADNISDMVSRGRQSAGRKFTEETVTQAKADYRTGLYTQEQVEARYGMSAGQMSRIMSKKIWAWVD